MPLFLKPHGVAIVSLALSVMASISVLNRVLMLRGEPSTAFKTVTSTLDQLASTYKHPVPEALVGDVEFDDLPLPIQVMEQYKEWHSVDRLMVPEDDDHRKYAVVFYSCPLQAGNRLHHFFTGMMWSILTNRTMLWKYWDTETCLRYGSEFSHLICESANQVEGCDAILDRAPWIPAYDDFAGQLGEEPYELPFYSTHPPSVVNGRYPWGPGNDEKSFGVDVNFDDRKVVIFAQTRFKVAFLKDPSIRDLLLHSDWAREAAEKLYCLGPDFLFGMLHRYSFSFADGLMDSVSEPLPMSHAFTVTLHSRHIDQSMDGCDIHREVKCLAKVLRRNERSLPCHVALMSDRSCTLSQVELWLEQEGHDCQVHVAQHESHVDFLSEHGPFAGAGFFQDLAIASEAKSSFIGLQRSSSDLVLELIEFNRMMWLWRQGRDPQVVGSIEKCMLEKIPPPDKDTKRPKHQENATAPCSCLNPKATKECCERYLRRTHKMGYVLTRDLFEKFDQVELTQVFRNETSSTVDFRDVVVTRDWYESLISGYLYHRSGKECYLDPFGVAHDYTSRPFYQSWTKFLPAKHSFPDVGNRTLCAYLKEESVRDGMLVYIHAAFGKWYDGLEQNFDLARNDEDVRKRTIFVCYEQMMDTKTRQSTFDTMLNWLFPAQEDLPRHMPLPAGNHGGSHSTDHNEALRSELKSVIVELDRSFFQDKIANLNAKFGCS